MQPNVLLTKAQELVNKYDELNDAQEMTDEVIDEILGAESASTETLQALLLAKKVQQQRRLLAEKEEDKIMQMITRLMKRARLDNFECEDGKIKGKIVTRWEYVDKDAIPEEYKAPARAKINSMIQKGEKVDGIKAVEGYLSCRVY